MTLGGTAYASNEGCKSHEITLAHANSFSDESVLVIN